MAQDSERALVPVGSELAGTPRVPNGEVDMPRLVVAAAFGLAVEVQRRSFDAAGAVAGRFAGPLRVLARPAAAFARGSVAVARHHLDLDGWAARGLAEQRRAREVAARVVGGLIASVVTDAQRLVSLEVALAKQELKEMATGSAIGLGLMAFGGLLLALAVLVVLPTLVVWLVPWHWEAAAVWVGAYFVIGLVLVLVGKSRLQVHLPRRTLESLKENKEWALRHVKSNGK